MICILGIDHSSTAHSEGMDLGLVIEEVVDEDEDGNHLSPNVHNSPLLQLGRIQPHALNVVYTNILLEIFILQSTFGIYISARSN